MKIRLFFMSKLGNNILGNSGDLRQPEDAVTGWKIQPRFIPRLRSRSCLAFSFSSSLSITSLGTFNTVLSALLILSPGVSPWIWSGGSGGFIP